MYLVGIKIKKLAIKIKKVGIKKKLKLKSLLARHSLKASCLHMIRNSDWNSKVLLLNVPVFFVFKS